MKPVLWLLPFALVTACGIFDSRENDLDSLRRNRARWEILGIRDYDYDHQLSCYCLPAAVLPVRIEVRDNLVSRVVSLQTGQVVASSIVWPTVDSLFVWTERHMQDSYRLRIDYDPVHRFPTRVEGDIPLVVDDEYVRTATNLTVR